MNLKYNIRFVKSFLGKWWIKLVVFFLILYLGYEMFNSTRESMQNIDIDSQVEKSHFNFSTEGYPNYDATLWSPDLIERFIKYQQLHNKNIRFDINILQRQASPEEVEELLTTGQWPWSPEIIKMYNRSISQNNIVNVSTGISLHTARTIYNQTAIKELLSWNSKEGNFLLFGSTIGHTKGLPYNINNIIRCSTHKDGASVMKKFTYTGYDGINGNLVNRVDSVSNEDIPKLVNGFKFLEGECNPCVAMNDPAEYSCPFALDIGKGYKPSPIWAHLWGIDESHKHMDGCGNFVSDSSFNSEIFSINKEIGVEFTGYDNNKYASFKSSDDFQIPNVPDIMPKKNDYRGDYGFKSTNIGS